MKIRILEPAPIDHRWFHTNIRTPHLGQPILATLLRDAGHDASVLSEFIADIPWPDIADAELIGVSVNTGLTHQRAYELVNMARQWNPDAPIVAGGHHATMNPRETLEHVDYVIAGYAEEAFPELVAALGRGDLQPRVAGLSYRDPATGEVVEHPQSAAADIDVVPDLATIHAYRETLDDCRWSLERFGTFLPLSFYSRGCAFRCNFCAIPLGDKKKMSYRSAEVVIEDLRRQLEFYSFPYCTPKIWLIDDNFGQHKKDTYDFLEKVAEAELPCKFVVQARIEISRDEKLLGLMRKAGFFSIYVGIESIAPESLVNMTKDTTIERVTRAVERIQAQDIEVVALLMFGNDGDRPGLAARTAEFLDGLGVHYVCPQITIPYPGTGFYRQVVAEGRLFSDDFSLCNRLPVHFAKTIRPSQVVREVCEFTRRHYRVSRVLADAFTRCQLQNLLSRKSIFAGGFIDRAFDSIPRLERAEEGFYDDEDRLLEDRVLEAYRSGELAERLRIVDRELPTMVGAPETATPLSSALSDERRVIWAS